MDDGKYSRREEVGGASDEPLGEKADEPKRKLVKTRRRRHAPSATGAAAASHGTRRILRESPVVGRILQSVDNSSLIYANCKKESNET